MKQEIIAGVSCIVALVLVSGGGIFIFKNKEKEKEHTSSTEGSPPTEECPVSTTVTNQAPLFNSPEDLMTPCDKVYEQVTILWQNLRESPNEENKQRFVEKHAEASIICRGQWELLLSFTVDQLFEKYKIGVTPKEDSISDDEENNQGEKEKRTSNSLNHIKHGHTPEDPVSVEEENIFDANPDEEDIIINFDQGYNELSAKSITELLKGEKKLGSLKDLQKSILQYISAKKSSRVDASIKGNFKSAIAEGRIPNENAQFYFFLVGTEFSVNDFVYLFIHYCRAVLQKSSNDPSFDKSFAYSSIAKAYRNIASINSSEKEINMIHFNPTKTLELLYEIFAGGIGYADQTLELLKEGKNPTEIMQRVEAFQIYTYYNLQAEKNRKPEDVDQIVLAGGALREHHGQIMFLITRAYQEAEKLGDDPRINELKLNGFDNLGSAEMKKLMESDSKYIDLAKELEEWYTYIDTVLHDMKRLSNFLKLKECNSCSE